MQTILAATLLVALAMLALGLGLFFGRPALKGSCGGLACGGACGSCERKGRGR
ncbi:hypothetical protein [Aureimonas populi]|uniref:(Na+)-NQR maturation NqrM n=1 Tax=Aureimonas populi TaxID=1701758 RepID=A0ABW5CMP4_9HYPH|nr:hypothetical protein [Aureimonas populi]